MDTNKKTLTIFLKSLLPVSDTVANTIGEHFEPAAFSKNEFILKQGKVANDFIFLKNGYIRAFTYDTEGNEVTTNINSQNSIVFEAASFIKRTPAKENLQAVTDCEVLIVKYDTFQTLFHTIPEFRELARENLVNGFIALKERTLGMINLTAEQRYEHLLKTRPELFQNIPLKHLASYLGVTDTSLSRIRKELAQK